MVLRMLKEKENHKDKKESKPWDDRNAVSDVLSESLYMRS